MKAELKESLGAMVLFVYPETPTEESAVKMYLDLKKKNGSDWGISFVNKEGLWLRGEDK